MTAIECSLNQPRMLRHEASARLESLVANELSLEPFSEITAYIFLSRNSKKVREYIGIIANSSLDTIWRERLYGNNHQL